MKLIVGESKRQTICHLNENVCPRLSHLSSTYRRTKRSAHEFNTDAFLLLPGNFTMRHFNQLIFSTSHQQEYHLFQQT